MHTYVPNLIKVTKKYISVGGGHSYPDTSACARSSWDRVSDQIWALRSPSPAVCHPTIRWCPILHAGPLNESLAERRRSTLNGWFDLLRHPHIYTQIPLDAAEECEGKEKAFGEKCGRPNKKK